MTTNISGITKPERLQGVTAETETDTETTTEKEVSSSGSEFETFLKGVLKSEDSSSCSEEELFAAMVIQRISDVKGEEAADKFKELLNETHEKYRKGDGFVAVEDSVLDALKQFVAGGELTAEEGDQVYSEAFASSQLDANTEVLFDSRGGANDPTKAMAELAIALKQAEEMVKKITSGESTVTARSLSTAQPNGKVNSTVTTTGISATPGSFGGNETITPNGTYVDGEKGFLFKPITNNEGKLAVLLPAEMTGHLLSVILKDENGDTIEEGQQSLAGVAETGQEKWNFSKKGGDYQDNLTVEVTLSDGSVKSYKIGDTSKRHD